VIDTDSDDGAVHMCHSTHEHDKMHERWCRVLLQYATHSNTEHNATHYNKLHDTATYCNILQHTATYCNILQHTATYCNTLQHTATYCNILQHTATYCNTCNALRYRIYGRRHRVLLQHAFNTLQHTVTHSITRQHTATYGGTGCYRDTLLTRCNACNTL